MSESESTDNTDSTDHASSNSSDETSRSSSSQPSQPQIPRVEPPAPSCSIQSINQLPEVLEWVDESTTRAISDSIDRNGPPKRGSCKICGFRGALRRVRVHAKQHKLRYFCPCQLNSVSRDSVYEHQKKRRGTPGNHYPLYTVDERNYSAFTRAIGWSNPPPFAPCVPTRRPNPDPPAPPRRPPAPVRRRSPEPPIPPRRHNPEPPSRRPTPPPACQP